MKLGIVVSQFSEEITSEMKETAVAVAQGEGMDVLVIDVPGAFDVPLGAKKLLEMDDVHAVATVGAVVKGETAHDDLICRVVADKLAQLSLDFNKPVALGIIGPGAAPDHAKARAKEYAERSVKTAIDMLRHCS